MAGGCASGLVTRCQGCKQSYRVLRLQTAPPQTAPSHSPLKVMPPASKIRQTSNHNTPGQSTFMLRPLHGPDSQAEYYRQGCN